MTFPVPFSTLNQLLNFWWVFRADLFKIWTLVSEKESGTWGHFSLIFMDLPKLRITPRNYPLSLVAKQFKRVYQISPNNAQKPNSKILWTDSVKFVTSYNPIYQILTVWLIYNYLFCMQIEILKKKIFPRKSFTTV